LERGAKSSQGKRLCGRRKEGRIASRKIAACVSRSSACCAISGLRISSSLSEGIKETRHASKEETATTMMTIQLREQSQH
jgi:hypothetical protein